MGRYTSPEAVLIAIGLEPDDPDLYGPAVVAVADAEDWLDAHVGHPFGDTDSLPGETVSELLPVDGPMIFLTRMPVVEALEVAIRDVGVGADEDLLESLVGYELLDPAAGILRLSRWWIGARLRITYVAGPDTVPSAIRRAALLLAANWLAATNPAAAAAVAATVTVGDVKAITIEGTLAVQYATTSTTGSSSRVSGAGILTAAVPDNVLFLLAPFLPRRRFWFAMLPYALAPLAGLGILARIAGVL